MEQIVVANNTCLLMVEKFKANKNKFKAKVSEIVATPLCLGNISKDWSVDNIEGQDLMIIFMILVLIMMLLQLMIV